MPLACRPLSKNNTRNTTRQLNVGQHKTRHQSTCKKADRPKSQHSGTRRRSPTQVGSRHDPKILFHHPLLSILYFIQPIAASSYTAAHGDAQVPLHVAVESLSFVRRDVGTHLLSLHEELDCRQVFDILPLWYLGDFVNVNTSQLSGTIFHEGGKATTQKGRSVKMNRSGRAKGLQVKKPEVTATCGLHIFNGIVVVPRQEATNAVSMT